MTTNEND